MKICLLLSAFICAASLLSPARKLGFTKTSTGIIIYTDSLVTGHNQAVKLNVISESGFIKNHYYLEL
ncbi:MAG: hypothetical protein ABIR81_12400 [Ginsengibacter sp.]